MHVDDYSYGWILNRGQLGVGVRPLGKVSETANALALTTPHQLEQPANAAS